VVIGAVVIGLAALIFVMSTPSPEDVEIEEPPSADDPIDDPIEP